MTTEEDLIRLQFKEHTNMEVFWATEHLYRTFKEGFEAGLRYKASNDEKEKMKE